MYSKLISLSLVSIIFITIISCDLEKLSGYDYSYNPLPESAIFTGTILNKFTLEPVRLAEISIANQRTQTDEVGKYLLYYHYGEDDQRNQPIDVKISADNYHDIDTSIIVFPENKLNAYLPYAAPIIERIALVDSLFYIQAIVSDYQGCNDITTVSAQYAYIRPGERTPSIYVDTKLTRVFVDSLNTSYYEKKIESTIIGYGDVIMDRYSVSAEDRRHFMDVMNSMEGGSNSLLFPISTD